MSNALPRSATTVALLADIPSTGHVGETGARRFAMTGDDVGARSAAFVLFAKEEVRAGRRVVALYPAWQSTDARKAVDFARAALRTDHIAGISVDLSPLALSLIADQLAYLAPYLPPGMVAALSTELPKHLLAGAWLRTVSGLSTLPTSLRQHMGSYAPTVSFLAYCAPSAQVGRLRPSDAISVPFRPVQPVQLLCSTPDPSITRVFDENLPQAIQPVATRTLPVQPLGSTYWGTHKYVEFVALSAHPQALAYAAGALRATECTWCGEPVTATPCPFCRGVGSGDPAAAHHPGPSAQATHTSQSAPAPASRNGVHAPQGPFAPRGVPSGAQAPVAPSPPPGTPPPTDPAPRRPPNLQGNTGPQAPRPPQVGPVGQATTSPWSAPPHRTGPNPPIGAGAPPGAPRTDPPPVPAHGHRPSAPPNPSEGDANPDGPPRTESPRTYSR